MFRLIALRRLRLTLNAIDPEEVAERNLPDTTKSGARMNLLLSAATAGLPFAILTSLVFAGSTAANGAMTNALAVSAIGFESRLWQREFAPNQKFVTARALGLESEASSSGTPGKQIATANAGPGLVAADLADPVPVIVTVQQTDAYLKQEAASTAVSDRMISEWDKVIANTAGKDGVGQGFTTNGPTLTTYLVAIVATIVAVGCTITPK